jgi:hypothetical protein
MRFLAQSYDLFHWVFCAEMDRDRVEFSGFLQALRDCIDDVHVTGAPQPRCVRRQ